MLRQFTGACCAGLLTACAADLGETPEVEGLQQATYWTPAYGEYLKNGECFDFYNPNSEPPLYLAPWSVCIRNVLRVSVNGDRNDIDTLTITFRALDDESQGHNEISVKGELGCLNPDTGDFTKVHVETTRGAPRLNQDEVWPWRSIESCPTGTFVDFFSADYTFSPGPS
jgi:hypothetical protein